MPEAQGLSVATQGLSVAVGGPQDAYSSAQGGQQQRTVRRSSGSGRFRQTGKGAKRVTGPQSPLESDALNSDSLDSTAIHGLPHQTPTTSGVAAALAPSVLRGWLY